MPGGVVEIHVPAALLDELTAASAGGPWTGVVADIAAQYADRENMLARLDTQPGDRYARDALARHVQVRDRTRCHVGCRRPARKSDLDHTWDHGSGGRTTQGNIDPCCPRHHLYKHELGWRLRQPEPGHFEWTSPLGRQYRTRGEPISPPLCSLPRVIPEPTSAFDPATRLPNDQTTILRLPPPETAPQPPPATTAPTEPAYDIPPF
ncbi:MAG: hypothetical protein M3Z25_16310 [Actinomycetota bacterium]|nr:hypothetical protein [Actinomycetota bacterium]